MTTTMQKGMLLLGTTVLTLQAFFLPIGIVYAGTTEMQEERQERVELPTMKNYLEMEGKNEPRFSFSHSSIQGTVEEPLKVTFSSDQEVTKVRITLPKEAKLVRDQLQSGVSIVQEEQSNQWMVHAEHAQQTFVLPMMFESVGNYEVSIDKAITTLEILEKEENSTEEQSEVDQDYVTEHDLEHQKNSDAQFLDNSTRSWNIDDFPLIISRGDQLLRPELIPDTYYYVQASNSSLPANVGWMSASDRRPLGYGPLTTINYIFPDIVQDTTGNNLNLFFNVSQATHINRQNSPGSLWGATGTNTFPGFTADISLKNSDGLLLEAPIHFYQSNNIAYTLYIKKDDLIGIVLPSTTRTLSVREGADSYTISSTASGTDIKGWIIRNGAQFQTTSRGGQGFSMFRGRPSTSAVKNLAFESFPIEGGSAESNKTSVFQGETVDISASSNSGYQFSRWEIVSGSDGVIEDVEARNTKFTMGSSDTVLRAVFEEIKYEVVLEANPINGGTPEIESFQLSPGDKTVIRANPNQAYDFVRWEIVNGEGSVIDDPFNAATTITMGNEDTTIRAVYEAKVVSPVDPMNPELEVDPENPPELPENQGALSIDFVSRFSFGKQGISAQTKNYYAQPQRLLNPDGTINAAEERPNYVQISDRRDESDRHGWTLSVTQNGQFINLQKHELKGSCLQLTNQQLASVQDMGSPDLSQPAGIKLIPGEKTELMTAKDDQGIGTWVYRFGDAASADKSVVLEVPPSSAPRASTYQTTLTWELSSVPDNQK